MDAHLLRATVLVAAIASLGANYRTANFIVSAPSPAMAEQIGKAAEKYRRELAIEWLGTEMRNWAQPCPITAQVGDQLGAGGATSFVFEHGEVFGWRMNIQGSLVRILDSVLPHEVTHTVFATHFRQPLPRWADEGACTTVEHTSEKSKQQTMLIDFLKTGRGIAFSQMFVMKDYPHDVMPLYSQGFSVARFLIQQGGKHKFLEFLADGLRDENWTRAVHDHYGINNLAALQNNWLDWVRKGSPALDPAGDNTLVAVKASPDQRRGGPRDRKAAAPDRASDGVGPQKDGPSVYDLAAAEKRPRDANPGSADAWRSSAEAGQRRGDASDAPPNASHQVTRPQDIERPRQVILEWSRPFQSADDKRPAGGAGSAASTN